MSNNYSHPSTPLLFNSSFFNLLLRSLIPEIQGPSHISRLRLEIKLGMTRADFWGRKDPSLRSGLWLKNEELKIEE